MDAKRRQEITKRWQEIEHTADLSLRVWGEDLRALFEHAALGMMSLLGGETSPGGDTLRESIKLRAPDYEMLLVDWLTELLYLIEDRGILISRVAVTCVSGMVIEAEVSGGHATSIDKHIKAATYHNLSIRRTGEGYETTIVFDV